MNEELIETKESDEHNSSDGELIETKRKKLIHQMGN